MEQIEQLTSQQERGDAIAMLAGAIERLKYDVSIAITPAEAAALVDFTEEN